MKLPSLRQVFKESTDTFVRFPLVLADAILGTMVTIVLVDHQGPPRPTVFFNILSATILGLPLLIALALFAEKKKWGWSGSTAFQMAGVLLLIAYAFTVPSDLPGAPGFHVIRLLIFAVALHLFVAVAPFTSAGEMNGFWHFNKALFLRFLTAFLYSLVLFAGLAIALAALDQLFGMNVPGRRYPQLWFVIIGIFNTWFFLADVPRDLDALDAQTEYPKEIKILAQYILFPLALVYLVILYAYVGKILIAWDWPKGWVSKLILGYSATGMFLLLLLHPIRDLVENVWIKTASRWFYVILIPLLVMLPLALWRRISEYGMTEGRYLALALGIWLTAMALYFIFSKTKNIKLVPASLCVLSLLVTFGPWGTFEVSERSQVGQLKEILERHSILVEGTIQKPPSAVPFRDTKQISSILLYLHDIHGFDGIQPWFRESLKADSAGLPPRFKNPALVARMMGIEYVRTWQSSEEGGSVSLTTSQEGVLNVDGYERMLKMQQINTGRLRRDFPEEGVAFRMREEMDAMTFIVSSEGKAIDSLEIDFKPLLDRLLGDYGNTSAADLPPEKMSVSNESKTMRVKVYLKRIQARREGDVTKPVSYDAEIFYARGK
ncbi:MAG TPA: hypothetical protein DCP63_04520 [Bacteroidetes bacterium]|nr:hypothetical protein [Bacteroidota bacterium]